MKAFALGVLFAGMLLGGAAAVQADDANPLEGTWKFKSFSSDGKEDPADKVATMEFVATGANYKVLAAGKEIEAGTFKTGKEGEVSTVDFTVTSGEDAGKTQPGIYKLEGTKLTCAYFEAANPARPKDLASADGQAFMVLEKGAAAAPSPAPAK